MALTSGTTVHLAILVLNANMRLEGCDLLARRMTGSILAVSAVVLAGLVIDVRPLCMSSARKLVYWLSDSESSSTMAFSYSSATLTAVILYATGARGSMTSGPCFCDLLLHKTAYPDGELWSGSSQLDTQIGLY